MPLSVDRLIRRLTLRQLQVFHAVHSQKGFGKAAELLGLTQPAVSAQIRQLEGALNQKLFEIVGRKVFTTAAGEMVADCVNSIFDELRVLQNDIHALEGQVSGELRLAAVNTAQYVVPYLMHDFQNLYPQIQMSLSIVNRANAIERLNENKDDLVIMGLVPQDRPFASLPFLENELVPIVPSNHPFATMPDISPQDFFSSSVLLRERGSGSRLAVEQHCHQQRIHLEGSMEFGSNDALKHAVIAGIGVAVLPRLSIEAELTAGLLKQIDIEGFPLRRSWCLVYPKGRNQSLAARSFISYVQDNLESLRKKFSRTDT